MKQLANSISFFAFFLLLFSSCKDKNIVTYYETGEKEEVYQFQGDSIKHGIYKRYAHTGILVEVATYKNGKLEGERILYNYETGVKEISEIYEADLLEGRYIAFHANGEMQSFGVYKNNKLNGTVRFFDTSGLLKNEAQFVDNYEVVPFKEYYENGQIKWEGTKRYDHYFKTKKDFGELKEYSEDGKLIRKIMCDEREICTTIWSIDGSHIK